MSGRRIDDHKFWAGGRTKDSVFPKGVHSVDVEDVPGGGKVLVYEDTSHAIAEQQREGVKQIRKHPLKPHYKN